MALAVPAPSFLRVSARAGAIAPQAGENPQGAFNMIGSAVQAAGSVATAGQVCSLPIHSSFTPMQ